MYTEALSPEELCNRVKKVCQQEFATLSARPYNYNKPGTNTALWWLIPSTDWPAYGHGKLFFRWSSSDHTAISCGLHIEKGLDESVRDAYRTNRDLQQHIMGSRWTWHHFLSDLKNGTVTTALAKAKAGTNDGVFLEIVGFYPRSLEFFDQTRAFYKFECSGSSGECKLLEADDLDSLMLSLKDVSSLEGAASELTTLMSNKFLWIDILLGVNLDISRTEQHEARPIVATDLWTKHLRPFKDWLRLGGQAIGTASRSTTRRD